MAKEKCKWALNAIECGMRRIQWFVESWEAEKNCKDAIFYLTRRHCNMLNRIERACKMELLWRYCHVIKTRKKKRREFHRPKAVGLFSLSLFRWIFKIYGKHTETEAKIRKKNSRAFNLNPEMKYRHFRCFFSQHFFLPWFQQCIFFSGVFFSVWFLYNNIFIALLVHSAISSFFICLICIIISVVVFSCVCVCVYFSHSFLRFLPAFFWYHARLFIHLLYMKLKRKWKFSSSFDLKTLKVNRQSL